MAKAACNGEGSAAQTANGYSRDFDGYDEGLELIVYWLLLKSRWRLIAVGTVLAVAATFLSTAFLMTPYYRATALLRPVGPESGANKLSGAVAALGVGALGGVAAQLGGGGPQGEAAQEYMAILNSYAFTMALVERYRLGPQVIPKRPAWLWPVRYSQWRLYRLMQKRFSCEYDRLSGNMTLHFLNPGPAIARRVLELYIEDLREKLRHREIQSAQAAKVSFEEEAKATPDVLLQTQLYELIARQVRRQKLAQVEADFAFVIIDPPVVDEKPYSPKVILDCVLAGILALFMLAFAVIARNSWSQSLERHTLSLAARNSLAAQLPPAAGQPPHPPLQT